MILIFGIVSIIICKNTLCTNKPSVIHVCSNCVIFVPGNVHFLFIFFFFGGGGLSYEGGVYFQGEGQFILLHFPILKCKISKI